MGGPALLERCREVRRTTEALCSPLAIEDHVIRWQFSGLRLAADR